MQWSVRCPCTVTETYLSSEKDKGKGRYATERNVPGKAFAGNGVWLDQCHPNGSTGVASTSEESISLKTMLVKTLKSTPDCLLPLAATYQSFPMHRTRCTGDTFCELHMSSPRPLALRLHASPGKQQHRLPPTCSTTTPQLGRQCAHFITSHGHPNKPSLLNRSPLRQEDQQEAIECNSVQ